MSVELDLFNDISDAGAERIPFLPEESPENDKKLYHSINEVAEMFGLNASILRFWEKEFKNIKPHKNKKGTRFYTQADIEIIRQIHYLVREKGLTLEGARQQLKNNSEGVKRNTEIRERLLRLKQELLEIQMEIREMKNED